MRHHPIRILSTALRLYSKHLRIDNRGRHPTLLSKLTKPLHDLVFRHLIKSALITQKQLFKSVSDQRIWTWGQNESITIAPPLCLETQITPELSKTIKIPTLKSKPFVCEIADVNLFGTNAIAVKPDGSLISEASAGMLSHSPLWRAVDFAMYFERHRFTPDIEIKSAFSLMVPWRENYFHWMLEALISLEGLEYYRKATGNQPKLIIPAPLMAWQRETLDLLGYDIADCIPWNYRIAKINTLVVSSHLTNDSGHRYEYFMRPSSCKWLRDKLLAPALKISNGRLFPKRIYLSRERANGRKILNEGELSAVLNRYGFSVIRPEEMTVSEQICSFHYAEAIIASGAALTNLLFANQPIVIETFSDPTINSLDSKPFQFYIQLNQVIEGKYAYLFGKNADHNRLPYYRDYSINPEDLAKLLDRML